MKELFTILLFIISVNSFAQLNSYVESKEDVAMAFSINFSTQTSPEVSDKFILSAKDNFEISLDLGPYKDTKKILNEAFALADCEKCQKVSEQKTENPIEYIFEIIEYRDVFLVTQFEDQYKVVRYQPKEQD